MKIEYRKAKIFDIPQLVQMRWEFQLVGRESFEATKEEFIQFCEKFFQETLKSGDWIHFVAEFEDEVIAHVSLQIIKNIPVPGMPKNYWGYLTNAYTKPTFRKKGIGTRLVENALNWADSNDITKIILWPRDASINIYKNFGFSQESEVMERKND